MVNKTFLAGFVFGVIGEFVKSIPQILFWKDWPNLIRSGFSGLPPFLTFSFLAGILADWFFGQQNRTMEISILVAIWAVVKIAEYTLDYRSAFLKPCFESGDPRHLQWLATLLYAISFALSLTPFVVFRDAYGVSARVILPVCAIAWVVGSATFFWIGTKLAGTFQQILEQHFTKIIKACHIGKMVDHELFDEADITELNNTEIAALRQCVERAHISVNNVNAGKLLDTVEHSTGTILTFKQLKAVTFAAQKAVLMKLEIIRAMCYIIVGNDCEADEAIELLRKRNLSDPARQLRERRERVNR